jgi:hypothetical protein
MAASLVDCTTGEQQLVARGHENSLIFTDELHFSVTITVCAKGKLTNGWKDSKDGGRVVLMCVLGDHRL